MNYLKVILISAVPVIEQRGAIPLGILLYDMNPVLTCALSFLGSLLPFPFVLLLFNIVFDWMKKSSFQLVQPLHTKSWTRVPRKWNISSTGVF